MAVPPRVCHACFTRELRFKCVRQRDVNCLETKRELDLGQIIPLQPFLQAQSASGQKELLCKDGTTPREELWL